MPYYRSVLPHFNLDAIAVDEEGYWTVIERGRAIRRRYHTWISVDAGGVVRPSEEKFGYTLCLSSAQLNISLHPSFSCTSSELEIQLRLTPLPREPEQPHRIYEQLYPESAHVMFYASPYDLARREYNRRREAQGLDAFNPEDYQTESCAREHLFLAVSQFRVAGLDQELDTSKHLMVT